jgi:hypothetical protein
MIPSTPSAPSSSRPFSVIPGEPRGRSTPGGSRLDAFPLVERRDARPGGLAGARVLHGALALGAAGRLHGAGLGGRRDRGRFCWRFHGGRRHRRRHLVRLRGAGRLDPGRCRGGPSQRREQHEAEYRRSVSHGCPKLPERKVAPRRTAARKNQRAGRFVLDLRLRLSFGLCARHLSRALHRSGCFRNSSQISFCGRVNRPRAEGPLTPLRGRTCLHQQAAWPHWHRSHS